MIICHCGGSRQIPRSGILNSMRVLAPTFVLLAALFSACGGESLDDEAYRDAAAEAVRNATLTLDDLPAGWTKSELGGQALAELELTGDCARLNGLGSGLPGQVATGDLDPLAGPLGQELVSSVSAFADPAAAEEAVRLAGDLVLQCTDQLEEALKQAIKQAAADRNLDQLIGNIDALVGPGGFRSFGDETAAYRLQANFSALFTDFEVNGHIIVIREGALTGVLIYAVLGNLDLEGEEEVAAILAGKLAKAEESLAD